MNPASISTPSTSTTMNLSSNLPDCLNAELLQNLLQQKYPNQAVILSKVESKALDNSSSILVTLTAAGGESNIGHFRFVLGFDKANEYTELDVVVKVKPHGKSIAAMLEGLAAANGEKLGNAYKAQSQLTGFFYSHEKELFMDDEFGDLSIFPKIYGISSDEDRGLFYIMMEYLGEAELMNSVMAPETWTDAHIKSALDQAAIWHAQGMDALRNEDFPNWPDAPSHQNRMALKPLYKALWENAQANFPDLLEQDDYADIFNRIEQVEHMQPLFDPHPKTLIHNDMNPRNACFLGDSSNRRFVLYDWELCTVHLPYYDIVEFLSFVLGPDRYARRNAYFDYYRNAFQKASGLNIDAKRFQEAVHSLHYEFCFLRLGMYLMAHALSPYPFLPRVVRSAIDGIRVTA